MCHVIKTLELNIMLPSLTKLADYFYQYQVCDCEHGFSTVKTKLRNRISNKVLIYLLMMSIEGPPPSDFLTILFVIFEQK